MGKSKEIKHLQSLEIAHRSAASPGMPDKYIIPTKYKDNTANGLTKCVIDWLRFNNCQAERVTSAGRVIKTVEKVSTGFGLLNKPGTKYIPGSGTNGTADISATINGRSVKIEVKIGRDKQSPAQVAYQKSVEQSGDYIL